MRTAIVLAMIGVAVSASAQPSATGTISGVVADPLGDPVEGATVLIVGTGGLEHDVVTGKDGRYAVTVEHTGPYRVVFVHGSSRTSGHVDVIAGKIAMLDGEVDPNTGEVIVIHDRPPPPVVAKPKARVVVPRYSDEAILHDVWTKAWLLLDISASGEVTRVKFLRRPGAKLEQIALETVFATRFDPAYDASGAAIRSRLVWGLEWPSHAWLITRSGTATNYPPSSRYVTCRGSGPLKLDMKHAVYRDCSRPELSAATKESWIDRPSVVSASR